MSRPLIFISHKHSDKEIATEISKFLIESTRGEVDIFQSSNPQFEGPRFGASINEELNEALWRCDTLILLYTTIDNDWSYCMYECGVATNPNSRPTKIIVFQCGKMAPDLYKGNLRVNVRSKEDLSKFITSLMKSGDFFPSLNRALSPNVGSITIEKATEELYNSIISKLPDPQDNIEEWTAWPFLRIQLPQGEVLKIINTEPGERLSTAVEIVKQHGIIIKNDSRIAQIFGLTSIPERGLFRDLLKVWNENYPNESATWFESCCEQIMTGARREFPVIKPAPLKEVNSKLEYVAVMSKVKYFAFGNFSQFDIYFYNLNDPRAVPVTSKMIKVENMFYIKIGKQPIESIKLKSLVEELDKSGRNRVPFLKDDLQPLYIIHRSMIDKFIANNIWKSQSISPADYSLKHLVDEEGFKELFDNSFVLVSKNSSLEQAKNKMINQPNCSDIFITRTGDKEEAVIGWLTNNDISREF